MQKKMYQFKYASNAESHKERGYARERERVRAYCAASPGVLRCVYTPIWVIQLSGTTDADIEPLIPFDSSNCLGCKKKCFLYVLTPRLCVRVCVCISVGLCFGILFIFHRGNKRIYIS